MLFHQSDNLIRTLNYLDEKAPNLARSPLIEWLIQDYFFHSMNKLRLTNAITLYRKQHHYLFSDEKYSHSFSAISKIWKKLIGQLHTGIPLSICPKREFRHDSNISKPPYTLPTVKLFLLRQSLRGNNKSSIFFAWNGHIICIVSRSSSSAWSISSAAEIDRRLLLCYQG